MDSQAHEMKCKKEMACLSYHFQKSKVIIAVMVNDTKYYCQKEKKKKKWI